MNASRRGDWLVGGGDLGALIRAMDWSTTALGPRDRWPQSLRTAVGLVVESRQAMCLIWGADGILLYNDAYRAIAAEKHPAALGRPAREVWADVCEGGIPVQAAVMERGEAVHLEDQAYVLTRGGRADKAFFTLSASPVRVEDGTVGGALVVLEETTRRKAIEEAHQASERRLDEAQRVGRTGSWEWNLETGDVRWSRELYALYGLDPERFVPSIASFQPFIHPDDRQFVQQKIDEVVSTGAAVEFEFRIVAADGATRVLVTKGQVTQFGADGKPLVMVGVNRDVSEHRRLEAELRASEERFRLAMDAAAEGIWDLDVPSGEAYYSPGYAAMLGYAPRESRGQLGDGLGLVHPEDAKWVMAEAFRLLDDPGHFALEFRLRRKDGSYCWVLSRGRTVERDADGKPTRAIGTHTDITARKLAEEERERSLAEFDATVSCMAEGVMVFRPDGTVSFMNAAAERILACSGERQGYTLSELFRRLEVSTEDGIPFPVDDSLTVRALRGEPVQPTALSIRTLDGRKIWIWSSVAAIVMPTGERVGAVAAFTDITERKRANQALRDAKEMLAEAQRIAHMGSFEYVIGTGTTVWSEEEYRIYGLDPAGPSPTYEELLARFIHPDDAALLQGTFSAALESRGIFELEHRIVRPDGSVRCVYNLAHPYFDEQGQVSRYVGTTLDITERKRAESEAQKRNELMQTLARQQVAVQTAAAFAHELNQPLMSISAYNEVALRALRGGTEKAGPLAQAIEGSHEQALRAGRVLREFIDHLHNHAGKPEPFDLNDLVREVADKMRRTEAQRFRATLDLQAGLPPVLGDRLRTEKVLANLIQNGLEAMEEAGTAAGTFAIAVRTLGGQSMAHVTVRDSGPGLDMETARRIFDPFFTTKAHGLGLGLPISRSLIESQQGQLWVDPEDGPGAVFHFTLPFAHG